MQEVPRMRKTRRCGGSLRRSKRLQGKPPSSESVKQPKSKSRSRRQNTILTTSNILAKDPIVEEAMSVEKSNAKVPSGEKSNAKVPSGEKSNANEKQSSSRSVLSSITLPHVSSEKHDTSAHTPRMVSPASSERPPQGSPVLDGDDNLKNKVPYCNCSPLFTDEILGKLKTSKKLSEYLKDKTMINRAGFQKELRELSFREKKAKIKELVSMCPKGYVGLEDMTSNIKDLVIDTTDYADILIIKNNKDGYIGCIQVYNDGEKYNVIDMCSKDIENIDNFMMMVYLLCVKKIGIKTGFMWIRGGYKNLKNLCVCDKFGMEVVNSGENYLGMSVNLDRSWRMRTGERKGELKHGDTTDAKIINTFFGHCRGYRSKDKFCKAEFEKLPEERKDKLIEKRMMGVPSDEVEVQVDNDEDEDLR